MSLLFNLRASSKQNKKIPQQLGNFDFYIISKTSAVMSLYSDRAD